MSLARRSFLRAIPAIALAPVAAAHAMLARTPPGPPKQPAGTIEGRITHVFRSDDGRVLYAARADHRDGFVDVCFTEPINRPFGDTIAIIPAEVGDPCWLTMGGRLIVHTERVEISDL